MAILVTQIAASTAALTWMFIDWFYRGKPSVQGLISGAIAGLVSITPGSGYVNTTGGVFLGFFAGILCYFGVKLKHGLGFDDSLDAFGVHAIGGIVGGILTGFFATASVCGVNGVLYGSGSDGWFLLAMQIYGIVVCAGWSAAMSLVLLILVDKTLGLRVSTEHEKVGLDRSTHGDSILTSEQFLSHRLDGLDIEFGTDEEKADALSVGRNSRRKGRGLQHRLESPVGGLEVDFTDPPVPPSASSGTE